MYNRTPFERFLLVVFLPVLLFCNTIKEIAYQIKYCERPRTRKIWGQIGTLMYGTAFSFLYIWLAWKFLPGIALTTILCYVVTSLLILILDERVLLLDRGRCLVLLVGRWEKFLKDQWLYFTLTSALCVTVYIKRYVIGSAMVNALVWAKAWTVWVSVFLYQTYGLTMLLVAALPWLLVVWQIWRLHKQKAAIATLRSLTWSSGQMDS